MMLFLREFLVKLKCFHILMLMLMMEGLYYYLIFALIIWFVFIR